MASAGASPEGKGLLTGRGAVVTGGGQGIGRAIAHALGELGAGVVVADVGSTLDGAGSDQSLAERVAEEIVAAGGRAVARSDDISDYEAAGRTVAAGVEAFGSVDILVNNAGISVSAPIWEMDPELFARAVSVHLLGTFNCTRHVVGAMRERGFGRIVNMVSRAGLQGTPNTSGYAAGKGGIFGFSNSVSRDLAPHGVTVNCVNPAATHTRMVTEAVERLSGQGGDDERRAAGLLAALQSPEQVAVLVAALCCDAAADITGEVFFVQRGEVSVFDPLSTAQKRVTSESWTAETLVEALKTLPLHALDEPY